MKKYFLSLFILLSSISAYSQGFEGMIKWSMKVEFKNNQQQESLSKPDNGEQMNEEIKKLEAQLKDPEFKKQIENNPQLKTLLEENLNRLKAMQTNSGKGSNGFMPTGFTIRIKDGNNLVKMEGGVAEMLGEILYLKSKDQSYSLKRKDKTYSIMPKSQESKEKKPITKITKTNETTKVIGYTCTKYIVDVTEGNKKIRQYLWTTKEIKDFDSEAISKMSAGRNEAKIYMEGVEGVPMKIENDNGDMKMTMEVIEFKKAPQEASLFSIPSDYKLVKGMGF